MGQMLEQRHLSFKLVFLLLRANDRLGVWGGKAPPWYDLGVFLEFHYLRVNINTLLCNPNLRYSESLLPYSHGRRQSVKPHYICVCVFFCFYLIFHLESLHENQHIVLKIDQHYNGMIRVELPIRIHIPRSLLNFLSWTIFGTTISFLTNYKKPQYF